MKIQTKIYSVLFMFVLSIAANAAIFTREEIIEAESLDDLVNIYSSKTDKVLSKDGIMQLALKDWSDLTTKIRKSGQTPDPQDFPIHLFIQLVLNENMLGNLAQHYEGLTEYSVFLAGFIAGHFKEIDEGLLECLELNHGFSSITPLLKDTTGLVAKQKEYQAGYKFGQMPNIDPLKIIEEIKSQKQGNTLGFYIILIIVLSYTYYAKG